MGDTGSLGLGGAIAGLAVMTRTEVLLLTLGVIFVIEALSVAVRGGGQLELHDDDAPAGPGPLASGPATTPARTLRAAVLLDDGDPHPDPAVPAARHPQGDHPVPAHGRHPGAHREAVGDPLA